ncbi:site-specific DNA-methyltransferase, partial [Candidatus Peregrinibacteria bacterium]|nr:site-specific DNA-methyltransferase [Candidatus Peregrinibacteria bacterium]
RLVQLYTFEKDVVLDPFCGSGTACLAALKDGRHYIGYDIEPEYVKLANRRIKEHSSQKNLFEHEPSSRTINPKEWSRQNI